MFMSESKSLSLFQEDINSLLKAREALDLELDALDAKLGTLTPAEKTRREEVLQGLDEISLEMNNITFAYEVSKTQEAAIDKTTKEAAKDSLHSSSTPNTLVSVPAPTPASAAPAETKTQATNFPKITSLDNFDIVSYMELTRHLNPYGRDRRCDQNLVSLVGLLSITANDEVKKVKALIKTIRASAKPS